jgi:hypothetical protein
MQTLSIVEKEGEVFFRLIRKIKTKEIPSKSSK